MLMLFVCFATSIVARFGDREGVKTHLYDYTGKLGVIHVINVLGSRGASRRENIRKSFTKEQQPYVYEPAETPLPLAPLKRASGCWDMLTTRGYNKANKNAKKKAELVAALVRSHANQYAQLLQSDMPFMIVAEDDVQLVEGFRSKLKYVLNNLPKDFDIVKLEWGNSKPNVNENTPLSIKPGQGGPCTGMYIVSRAGALLLLRTNPPLQPCWAADGALDINHREFYTGDLGNRMLHIYHVNPALAWQNRQIPSQLGLIDKSFSSIDDWL